ncbi:hypothetical protein SAMN05660649_00617 [Desulfotomaculum arcticum]|uniref:Uncharacterized protein n=1 Tax=Desulfotruncus arcticus DSM 17038 TaxID=1121424 RepID=A0A1I2NX84_9FIRM|nr:hypothetical protein [Desulfotruncus arcticus]SFG08545.1 hypothetical protein SAMN05660649_00617 [Desulfotomaculum arcticum] [Desulfotruncus arcticus DSM 17038]
MDCKYLKTWEQIVEENQDTDDRNVAAMKAKMLKSEDIIFQFVMNLLL